MQNILKSVKSINPFKSVIQTDYDIVYAHGGELKVETQSACSATAEQAGKKGAGTEFTIQLPII